MRGMSDDSGLLEIPVLTEDDLPSREHAKILSWARQSGATIDPHLAREDPKAKRLRLAATGLARIAREADDHYEREGVISSWTRESAAVYAEQVKRFREAMKR